MTWGSDRTIAYGLDLAGYSQGKKSALVRVEWPGKGPVKAKSLRDHPFARPAKGIDKLDPEREQNEIDRILAEGHLCVDVPIDLQDLMGLDSATSSRSVYPGFIWELTLRPVDYAFHARPPLADRIGALVVRFRNILTKSQKEQLGSRLWETYPGATLELVTRTKPRYKKGRAKSDAAKWVPSREGCTADEELACLATVLSVVANPGTELNDDELDAVLCALTGIAPQWALLRGHALEDAIVCRIRKKLGDLHLRATPPRGYVLLKCKFWEEIHLTGKACRTEEDQG